MAETKFITRPGIMTGGVADTKREKPDLKYRLGQKTGKKTVTET